MYTCVPPSHFFFIELAWAHKQSSNLIIKSQHFQYFLLFALALSRDIVLRITIKYSTFKGLCALKMIMCIVRVMW
jgi:hypothetical protein